MIWRVSSKEQKEGYSIKNQELPCEKITKVLREPSSRVFVDEDRPSFKNISRVTLSD